MAESLGQFLKREREFRNVSLEDLSQVTKIKNNFLKGMEEDRFETLPKGIIMKGMLRSYARQVGLNVDEVLSRYEILFPSKLNLKTSLVKQPPQAESKSRVIAAVIFFVMAIALVIYLSSR